MPYNRLDEPLPPGWWARLIGTIVVFVLILVCLRAFACQAEQDQIAAEAAAYGNPPFAVEVTDPWEMHANGLPTKADVLNWHMSGYWGYSVREGDHATEVLYDELPGGSEVWDILYGLDHESEAYEYV